MTKYAMTMCCLIVLVCSSRGTAQKIYWTDDTQDAIWRADLNGTNRELLVTGLHTPRGIEIDPVTDSIFWGDYGSNRIQRADLDGQNVSTVVANVTGVRDIAVDGAGGRVYWTDLDTGKIQRSDLTGGNVEDLVTTGLLYPYTIELDLNGGKMYWEDRYANRIERANLDGSQRETVVNLGAGAGFIPAGFGLDLTGGYIYYPDFGSPHSLRRARLNGGGTEILIPDITDARGMTLDLPNRKMYWVENFGGQDVIWRNNFDATEFEPIILDTVYAVRAIAIDHRYAELPEFRPLLSYANFTAPTGLNLVGNARTSQGRLQLTTAGPGQRGAVWLENKQPVGSGFRTSFEFEITDRNPAGGGDGFAFIIQNESDTALGGSGGALGYLHGDFLGLSSFIAVEFDTYFDGEGSFDISGNEIAIQSVVANSNVLTRHGITGPPFSIKKGGRHTADVIYDDGVLSVHLDNASVPILEAEMDLSAILGLTDGLAWIGFTAGTGGAWETHNILNWSYGNFRVPGDFNSDGELTASDLDVLSSAIRFAAPDPSFDLNSDGQLDSRDHRIWVEELKGADYGDVNFDGMVDATDFDILNNYLFQTGSGWGNADFNGDGFTDVEDFNIWSSHRSSLAGQQAVPEPHVWHGAIAAVLGGWICCRQRRTE